MKNLDDIVENLRGLLKSHQNNSQKQIKAIQLAIIQINNCRNKEEHELVIEAMIKGYVLEEIYELIGSLDFQLQEYIVEFLKFFADSSSIYKCNKSILMLQAITRSLHYFIKDEDKYQIVLIKYLNLESTIIKKLNLNIHEMSQFKLADFLKALFPILMTDLVNAKHNVVDLIRVILKSWNGHKWTNMDEEDCLMMVKCLKSILNREYKDKLIALFTISNTMMGCSIELNQIMGGIKMTILDIILNFVQNDVCDIMKSLSVTDMSQWNTFDSFFSCLRNIYTFEDNKETLFDLTNQLISIDIFSIIFTRHKQYFSSSQSGAKLVKLLYEIVLFLSLKKLGIGETSPNDVQSFTDNLLVGMQGLSEDCNQWPKLISNDCYFESYQALLIIGYFWNLNSSISYFSFEGFSGFINRVSEKYPDFIVKILWFNFAVAVSSEKTTRNDLQCFGASSFPKLVQLISPSLSNVVIYKPIILGSIFFMPQYIPDNFQRALIKLFLTHTFEGSEIQDYLILLIFQNKNFADCIFSSFKETEDPQELKLLLKLVKTCFNYEISENIVGFLGQCMLQTLPVLIRKMGDPQIYPDKEKEIIFWISKIYLTNWSQEAIINCNSAIVDLVEIIIQQSKEFKVISLLLRLFSMILNAEILNTVAINLLGNLDLIKTLMKLMDVEDQIVTILATNVLEKLMKKSIILKNNFNSLIIDLNHISIDFNPTKESQLKIKLSFLHTLFESNVSVNYPILQIRRNQENSQKIRPLYFKLSMMVTVMPLESLIWRCLSSILNFVRQHYKDALLMNQICTQPWNHTLIEKKFGINKYKESFRKEIINDEDFFEFLSSWLHLVSILFEQHNEENSEKFKDRFSQSIQKQLIVISKIFIELYFPKWNVVPLDVQKRVITCSNLISTMKELLPEDLEKSFLSFKKTYLEYNL